MRLLITILFLKYISSIHPFSRKYFRNVCDVEEPEIHFNMDQFTDVTRVTKPVIYISIAEIIETHKVQGWDVFISGTIMHGGEGCYGNQICGGRGWTFWYIEGEKC